MSSILSKRLFTPNIDALLEETNLPPGLVNASLKYYKEYHWDSFKWPLVIILSVYIRISYDSSNLISKRWFPHILYIIRVPLSVGLAKAHMFVKKYISSLLIFFFFLTKIPHNNNINIADVIPLCKQSRFRVVSFTVDLIFHGNFHW